MPNKNLNRGMLNRFFSLEIEKRQLSGTATAPAEAAGNDSQQADNLVLSFPFASEEPYLRVAYWDDPWVEVLGVTDAECDLARLNAGAAVFANHGRDKTDDSPLYLIGKTICAWIQNNRAYVEIKLSRRDGMEGLLQDIADELVPNVSVGYQILERTLIKSNGDAAPDEYRVTKWQPVEITLCDIPADATVGMNRSISTEGALPMKPNELKTTEVQIREIASLGNLDQTAADDMIKRNLSIDAARIEVLNKMAARSTAQGVTSRADFAYAQDMADPAVRARLMGEALACRFSGIAPSDAARSFVGMRVIDMAKELLEARGVSANRMSPSAILERAMNGTSDFPNLLLATGDRSLRAAYLSYAGGIKNAARETTAIDFRNKSRLKLGEMPQLLKVGQNGEFTRGSTAESAESYALSTYGRIFGITRQAIINDDLGAFVTVSGQFGRAAAEFEATYLVNLLVSNPVMADTKALFYSTHGNLAGAGAAINVTTLGAAKLAMRLQKGLDGATPIDATPKYLIVPAALETVALQYLAETTPNQSSSVNPFAGQLALIVDPRLDASSATRWYLAADPATIDGLEYAYLEGQQGPYIEQRIGFDVDGVEIKCRLDFGAGFVDYRGWYSNPGA